MVWARCVAAFPRALLLSFIPRLPFSVGVQQGVSNRGERCFRKVPGKSVVAEIGGRTPTRLPARRLGEIMSQNGRWKENCLLLKVDGKVG